MNLIYEITAHSGRSYSSLLIKITLFLLLPLPCRCCCCMELPHIEPLWLINSINISNSSSEQEKRVAGL